MTTMLADVVNSGTAWPARRVGFTLPAAGKTGTTNDYRDAWFVGFTPHLVSGVWIGYDQPRTIMAGGYAAELAVPLWGRFMMQATKGNAPDWYQAPAAVTTATICPLSGKLATAECARGRRERLHRLLRGRTRADRVLRGSTGAASGRGVLGTLAAGSWAVAPAIRCRPRHKPGSRPRAARRSSVAGSEPAAVAPAASEAPKKKRGFWSRGSGTAVSSRRPSTTSVECADGNSLKGTATRRSWDEMVASDLGRLEESAAGRGACRSSSPIPASARQRSSPVLGVPRVSRTSVCADGRADLPRHRGPAGLRTPTAARNNRAWWTGAVTSADRHAEAWAAARRTATPNLAAPDCRVRSRALADRATWGHSLLTQRQSSRSFPLSDELALNWVEH